MTILANSSEKIAPLSEHLNDLRGTLIKVFASIFVATFIAFLFYPTLFFFLTQPVNLVGLASQTIKTTSYHKQLVTLAFFGPLDGFSVILNLSFLFGFALSSPLWLFFIAQFLLPALKNEEKKVLLLLFLSSFFILFLGFFLGYKFILPKTLAFFASFNEKLASNIWSVRSYLKFASFVLISTAFVLELTFSSFLFVHFRLISYCFLKKYRKHSFIVILILSALLTPPDVASQLLLAIPLVLFYEIISFYAKLRR